MYCLEVWVISSYQGPFCKAGSHHWSHSQHVEEPFPLFTAHFLPICFSIELPILPAWVGYTERKGAIPPLPRHSSHRDHSPLQEGGSLHAALLQKSSFSGESLERDKRPGTQLPPQINAGVQGELPALGKRHPQAAQGPAARAARGRGHPKYSLFWLHFPGGKGLGGSVGRLPTAAQLLSSPGSLSHTHAQVPPKLPGCRLRLEQGDCSLLSWLLL